MNDKHCLSYYLEVKSQSATNVTLHPLGLGLFAQWKKRKTNAAIVTLYHRMQVHLQTHRGVKQMQSM